MATLGVTLLFLRLCFLAWTLQVATSQRCEAVITASPSNVVQFGDQLLLYCAPAPGVSGSVSWTKHPSMAIMASGVNPCHCTAVYNDTSASVFLNVTDDTDVGLYECNLQVSFSVTCMERIQVIKAVIPVLTPVINTNQTASQGSNVTFSVNSTNPGLPLANVVWSKNGVSLSNTSNMVVTNTMLQLSNIQAGDRGQYVVTATNKAGSNSVSFNLYVQFITVVTSRDVGTITCTALSYPGISSLILKDTSESQTATTIHSNVLNNFTYQAFTMLQGSTDCSRQYSCDGVNSAGILNVTKDQCTGSNPVLNFKPVGSNGVFIQWSPAGSIVMMYVVKYRVAGTSTYSVASPIFCGAVCNTTVTGLTLGVAYVFSVGTFPEQLVVATQGLAPVTGVVATPSSSYIIISWNTVSRATGYLILVSQGTNSSFIQNVTTETNTTLVPGLTCGVLYTFKVQAYNALNLSSPSPSDGIQTTNYCSTSPGILSLTVDGTMVKVTLFNLVSVTAIKITATSDSGMVYYYNLLSLGGLCLGGLSQNTLFTICASFFLESGDSVDDCYAQKVQTGVGTSSVLCGAFVMNPSGTIAGPTSETTGIQPWVIGLLVVGLLGLVATIFCVMGMYLACRPDKTDPGNFGSSLSLDTSPSSQTNNSSFKTDKSVSPPRSCLSRSTKSHNISWKDQMDTIRQLETNGTNV